MSERIVSFDEAKDLIFHKDKQLPYHPNGMRFTLYDKAGKEVFSDTYYSVGGGFILNHQEAMKDGTLGEQNHPLPYPFKTGQELLDLCNANRMTIAQIMMENEKSWRSEKEIKEGLLNIWNVMVKCVERGCHQEGILPRRT